MENSKNLNKCNYCKFTCEDKNDLQKHEWKYHPKNEYEKLWSKHAKQGFINWKGSSYFESFGPYY